MTIFETVTLMHKIEGEINEKLERKLDSYKWVNYKNYTTYLTQSINSTRYYLIIS